MSTNNKHKKNTNSNERPRDKNGHFKKSNNNKKVDDIKSKAERKPFTSTKDNKKEETETNQPPKESSKGIILRGMVIGPIREYQEKVNLPEITVNGILYIDKRIYDKLGNVLKEEMSMRRHFAKDSLDKENYIKSLLFDIKEYKGLVAKLRKKTIFRNVFTNILSAIVTALALYIFKTF